jgi:hypothetical protein
LRSFVCLFLFEFRDAGVGVARGGGGVLVVGGGGGGGVTLA